MLNPRITSSVAVRMADDLDTSDLQGVGLYRGKEIKKSRIDDAAFGIHDEGDEQEGKSTGSTKGELKQDFDKREKSAFSDQEENLPDFGEFSNTPDFKRFMAQLRHGQRGGNYEEIREALDSNFQDPTLKNAALEGALKMFGSETDDPGIKELLGQVLRELKEQSGSEIRAGYNVSNVAAETVGSDADLVAALRNFYCEVVFSDQKLVDTYHYIMSSFPDKVERAKRDRQQKDKNKKGQDEEAPDGVEGQARLEKAIEFLLKSLAAELTSNRPSLEAPLLKKVMDGLCDMEFFRNAYRSFLQMLTKMNINCATIPVAPSRLINEILTRVTKENFTDDEFLHVAQQFSVPPLQLSIEFLTRIYEMIRLFPERIFSNNMTRENCLMAVQRSLDAAIARESEVAI